MWSWRDRTAVLGPVSALVAAAGLLLAAAPAVGAAAPGDPAGVTASAAVADLVVSVTVTPNRPGPNVFSVVAASSRRPAPSPVTAVDLRLSVDGVLRVVPLTELAPGRYSGSGRLERPGAVTAEAAVRRSGGRVGVPLSWIVAPAAVTAAPDSPPTGGPDQRGPFVAVGLAPLVGGLALGAVRIRSARRRRGGATAAEALVPEGVR